MVQGNSGFVRWSVGRLAEAFDVAPDRVAEIGPGPGVGLEAALAAFPRAIVLGVEPSTEMLAMARRRNRGPIAAGRLSLLEGAAGAVVGHGPFDLVFCTHVLYFWDDPVAVLESIRSAMRPGGLVGIGYQLAKDMPAVSRERFPLIGHSVYESDEEVDRVVTAAGLTIKSREVKGPLAAPHGRLVIAARLN